MRIGRGWGWGSHWEGGQPSGGVEDSTLAVRDVVRVLVLVTLGVADDVRWALPAGCAATPSSEHAGLWFE